MTAAWDYLTLTDTYCRDATSGSAWHDISIEGVTTPVHAPGRYATLIEALGMLGASGWELVSETILDTVIFDHAYGWQNVGTPIRIRYLFRRPSE